MKGLGVFSPSSVTSRYVLVASGLYESSLNGTPRVDNSPMSLNLLDFRVTDKVEKGTDVFSNNFDNTTNFSQFPNDTPFSFTGANFDDYMGSQANNGIAEFTVLHSVPVDLPNGYLTTMRWLKLGPTYGENKTLVAVGSNTGDVLFYDADAFVNNKTVVTTFSSKVCNVPVKCLGYCGKNMLGIAGLDGQVSVVDLGDPSNYNVVDVSFGKWKVGMVTSLSWNYRLSHILASSGAALTHTDTSGVVVWDLKVRKPASTFRDQTGRLNPVALDWVPDQPTQLVVAYGDDNSPSLQLWDLRNCSAPLSEVKAHTRGLTDLKFSPHDPSLLLTSSKDDTTKCWQLTPERNFNLVSSLQTDALSHHSRVEWHLNAPGLFLSQANDGELCVHHLFSGNVEGSYMPLWTRKKAGLVSGFAGQVTTWTTTDLKSYTLSSEYDSKTSKLLDSTLEVLSVLHDETMFTQFCESKVVASTNEYDKLTWSVLKSQYQGELKDLLDVMGYSRTLEVTDSASSVNETGSLVNGTSDPLVPNPADLVVGLTNTNVLSHRTNSSSFVTTNRTSTLSDDTSHDDKEAEDFFNSLTLNTNLLDFNNNVNSTRDANMFGNEQKMDGELFGSEQNRDKDVFGTSAKSSTETQSTSNKHTLDWCNDKSLRNNLVYANYFGAAKRCLELNKVVESLLLGYVGGHEVFMELVERVVNNKKDPFLNLLHLLMQNDVESVLNKSNVKDWKETLCVLYTYSSDNDVFRDLAYRFGKRLVDESMFQEASICFILASEYQEVVTLWRYQFPSMTARSTHSLHGSGSSGKLEERMEMLLKLSVLSFSTTKANDNHSSYGGVASEHFDAVLMELSEVFVDAGQLDKALETLNVKGASNSEQMVQLKSKIQNQLLQAAAAASAAAAAAPSYASTTSQGYQPTPVTTTPVYQPSSPTYHPSTTTGYHQTTTAAPGYHPTATHQPSGFQKPQLGYQHSLHQSSTVHHPVSTGLTATRSMGYQPPVTSTPVVPPTTGLNTSHVSSVSQSMTSTTTRTVPLTALQTTSHSGVGQTVPTQPGYGHGLHREPVSSHTSRASHSPPLSNLGPSHVGAAGAAAPTGLHQTTSLHYGGLQRSASSSTHSGGHPTTTHPSQASATNLTTTLHPNLPASTTTTTHPSSLSSTVATTHPSAAQATRPGHTSASPKAHPLTGRPSVSQSPNTTVPTYPASSRAGSTTSSGMGYGTDSVHSHTQHSAHGSSASQMFVGATTAPNAVATALKPGMPIPWPNPTPTQQLSSKTVSTQETNKLVIASTQDQPKGEKMAKPDLDLVVTTLRSLVANLGDSKPDLNNKKVVDELINSLNQGMLTSEANSLLATLCKAVSNGDNFNSEVILNNIISKLWNNQNKGWIMCLKRLVPK